jgi:hypothetical protein
MSAADKYASRITAFFIGCLFFAGGVAIQKHQITERERQAQFEKEQAARYYEMISREPQPEPIVQLHP